MLLADVKQVYFIGIGGIGMSAIARYFNGRGLLVAGYDKTETPLTWALESEGIVIHYGDARPDLVPDAADDLLVIWTPAIPADFAELVKVQNGGYHLLKRAAVLGLLSKSMDCVAIAGTHGKTTTTTFATYIMDKAGLSPHAFLGGIPVDYPGNYVAGTSNTVVVEADEYDRSFLHLHPKYAVVLSCDPDHLDIYGDHEAMLETGFRAFARQVKSGGFLVVKAGTEHVFAAEQLGYGLTPNPVSFAAALRRSEERGDEAGGDARFARGVKTVNYWDVKKGHDGLMLQFAKQQRQNGTKAEKLLWKALRNRALGDKFIRQKPMGYSIPDFVCLEKRVVIEVDGGYHNLPKMILKDKERDLKFSAVGYETLRFSNEEVEEDIESVIDKIKSILSERKARPYKFPVEEYQTNTLVASETSPLSSDRRKAAAKLTGSGVRPLLTFGIDSGDYAAHNVHVENGAFHFDLHEPDGNVIKNLKTSLPGRHNVENAVAACAVTRLAGGTEAGLREGLATFGGIRRRFEIKVKTDKLVIIDDYAHHPTELDAAIGAAKELYPNRKITGVFQPHLFSRTADFAAGFAASLDALDEAILIPIYPAREKPMPGVTSQLIFDQMKNPNRRLLSDEEMVEVTTKLTDGVLLLLGAGNIDALISKIITHHQNTAAHGQA